MNISTKMYILGCLNTQFLLSMPSSFEFTIIIVAMAVAAIYVLRKVFQ
jgi:hypothetical protein